MEKERVESRLRDLLIPDAQNTLQSASEKNRCSRIALRVQLQPHEMSCCFISLTIRGLCKN